MDLIQELGLRAGFEVEVINQPWDGIMPGLQAERYDAVISSLSITPDREQEVLFSDPYLNAGQVIAVREDQQGIETLDDLKGKKIGAQKVTTGADKAKEVWSRCGTR